MKRFHKLNLDIEKKITYDQPHRKSFFQKEYVKMEWSRHQLMKLSFEFDITLQVSMMSKKQGMKQKTLMIHENILATNKKDGSRVWIDYENSIVEPISHLQYGKGIRLIKCFDTIEFYGDFEKVLPIIKRFAVQLEFSQQFVYIKKINCCEKNEVFRIKSKLDRNDFQCRVINKKHLTVLMEQQIEKEHYILRRVNEECIQKYYGTFENQDQILIISELLIGGSLDSYLQRWSLLSEEKASKFFFKLFKTLAYLHSKGVMHRDLKPENIGLRLNGNLDNPCITSFALADIINPKGEIEEENKLTHLYHRCGTPGYVAPEILKNQQYDCKVDVYSMGIIFFQTLTGKKPFDSEDYQEIIEANEEGIVDISILKLSKEGMHFSESILQADPEDRITAQIALNHQWFRNEKLSNLMEYKAHKRMKKIKFKSSHLRVSQSHQPNLLPALMKSENSSNAPSPLFQHTMYTKRDSIKNSLAFRISTLNSSFSPKDFKYNQTKSHFNLTFNNRMIQNDSSPIYPIKLGRIQQPSPYSQYLHEHKTN